MAEMGGLTGVERTFPENDIIVSKTDTMGRITYANDVFLSISDYAEREVMGKPHSIIRHPDMPRCVFKLLWDTVGAGGEIFAYVVNRAKMGDHYWVLAHVTPTFGANGEILGYHSNRRVPNRQALPVVKGLYVRLKAEEDRHSDRKAGMAASTAILLGLLKDKGISYGELIFSLEKGG